MVKPWRWVSVTNNNAPHPRSWWTMEDLKTKERRSLLQEMEKKKTER